MWTTYEVLGAEGIRSVTSAVEHWNPAYPGLRRHWLDTRVAPRRGGRCSESRNPHPCGPRPREAQCSSHTTRARTRASHSLRSKEERDDKSRVPRTKYLAIGKEPARSSRHIIKCVQGGRAAAAPTRLLLCRGPFPSIQLAPCHTSATRR